MIGKARKIVVLWWCCGGRWERYLYADEDTCHNAGTGTPTYIYASGQQISRIFASSIFVSN